VVKIYKKIAFESVSLEDEYGFITYKEGKEIPCEGNGSEVQKDMAYL
jgi:hypothetical protein